MSLRTLAQRYRKPIWLVAGLVILAAVGVLDFFTGSALSLSVFYLVPILLMSWFVGRWAGLLAFILSGLDLFVSEVLLQPAGGDRFLPLWNATLELGLFLVVIYLTTTLRATLERERGFARTDHQTGAMNARAFEESAGQEIRRMARYGKPFTVAFADLDDFKSINDRFGHTAGDEVLQTLVETLKANLRGSDVVARLGGDEFALLLPECGAPAAPAVLRRLHQEIGKAMSLRGRAATVSVGAATFERPPGSYDEMIRTIDRLMYDAKRSGKNGFRHEVVAAGERGDAPTRGPDGAAEP